jgi:hypothetical protein
MVVAEGEDIAATFEDAKSARFGCFLALPELFYLFVLSIARRQ